MAKINKYLYLFVIQCYYDCWEDETFADTYKDARGYLKDYRNNVNRPVRMIRRRELNPEYQCMYYH